MKALLSTCYFYVRLAELRNEKVVFTCSREVVHWNERKKQAAVHVVVIPVDWC